MKLPSISAHSLHSSCLAFNLQDVWFAFCIMNTNKWRVQNTHTVSSIFYLKCIFFCLLFHSIALKNEVWSFLSHSCTSYEFRESFFIRKALERSSFIFLWRNQLSKQILCVKLWRKAKQIMKNYRIMNLSLISTKFSYRTVRYMFPLYIIQTLLYHRIHWNEKKTNQ